MTIEYVGLSLFKEQGAPGSSVDLREAEALCNILQKKDKEGVLNLLK